MSNDPLVSVCMVTFNHEVFIAKAIEGVLMQEGDFDLRLIIGDDASKDGTGEVCQQYADKYPQKILYYRNETNLGPKLNFYKAMKMMSGEYIAFCEGDDYWTDPNKLQKQIVFLQENREYNICFHKTKILLEDGRLVNDLIAKIPRSETTIDDLVRMANYIHTPSVVFRNNFILPEWYWNCPIGDYPLYLLAVRNGKIKCFDEPMAVYRFGGGFSKLSPVKKRIPWLITLNELTENYPDERIRKKLVQKQRSAFLFFISIFLFFGDRDIKDLKSIVSIHIRFEKRNIMRFFRKNVVKKNALK